MKKYIYTLLLLPSFALGQVVDSCYSINDFLLELNNLNPSISIDLEEGWNLIGSTCYESLETTETFEPYLDKIIIVKDNVGNVYLPEYNFNNIDSLRPGLGYQIKINEPIADFSLCSNLENIPIIEGCTDCFADNFHPMATVDDGSCLESEIDSTDKVLLLHVDFMSNTFLGGKEFHFPQSSDLTLSWTSETEFSIELIEIIQLYYSELDELLFEALISSDDPWDPWGYPSIYYPMVLDTMFESISTPIEMPDTSLFEIMWYDEENPFPYTNSSMWSSINNLEVVENYRNTNPGGLINIFILNPLNVIMSDWSYIVILKN